MAVQINTKQSLAQRWEDYQPSKSTLGWTPATGHRELFVRLGR